MLKRSLITYSVDDRESQARTYPLNDQLIAQLMSVDGEWIRWYPSEV